MARSKLTASLLPLALFAILAGRASADTVVKGKDGPVQITVPDGWAEHELPDNGDFTVQLMAISEDGDLGAMVVYEAVKPQGTLDDYAKKVVDQMEGRLSDATHTDSTPVKVDGKNALQCEIRGKRSDFNLVYVVTVLKTDDSYDQIVTWAKASSFDNSKKVLAKITDSFQVKPVEIPTGPHAVRGTNGITELTVPGGWVANKRMPGKDIQLVATDSKSGSFVMVVSEDKKVVGLEMKDYADKVIANMENRGADGSHTDWESVKVNGRDALRCDLHLTVRQVKLAYVVTIIETDDRLHQVLAWTTEDSFKKLKPDLSKLADGLKEVVAGK